MMKKTMQLNDHQQQVIQRLQGAGWLTQRQLKTSRQTLNLLRHVGLVERKLNKSKAHYVPECGQVYRLRGLKK